ncbi:MAG: hypothetical protein HYR56_05180 [Acidobacteria bacterium]|nr:hypothetical protein [Acidobacteriota bacterium]MBI3423639.1 hypothetical protein [Acidobacteriota bacterium]
MPELATRAEMILQTAVARALQPRLEKLVASLQQHHTRPDLTPLRQLIQQFNTPNP